jgi:hypothetical protein
MVSSTLKNDQVTIPQMTIIIVIMAICTWIATALGAITPNMSFLSGVLCNTGVLCLQHFTRCFNRVWLMFFVITIALTSAVIPKHITGWSSTVGVLLLVVTGMGLVSGIKTSDDVKGAS